MYLVVVVTLVIGMIGIYAQVLSLQAARFAAGQNGLATAMMTWHAAAVSMGASVYDTGQLVGRACSLTYTLPVAGLARCKSPVNSLSTAVNADGLGTLTDSTNSTLEYIFNTKALPSPGVREPVHLPASYQIGRYQFYSVLYLDSMNHPNVVTFVQPNATNPTSGLLALPPTGNAISLSMADLLHQMNVSSIPGYACGTVQNANGNSTLLNAQFQYAMPQISGVNILNDGAAAIVSSTAGF